MPAFSAADSELLFDGYAHGIAHSDYGIALQLPENDYFLVLESWSNFLPLQ